MSKRKVHFASTNDEAIEDAINEEESGKHSEKCIKLGDQNKEKNHTLDSDDEIDEDKYNVLEDDDIEGQEDSSNAIESEGRFTGFNMKEELQEGHFDKQGTFIFDKDNNQITDNWMDNVDWVKVKQKQGQEKDARGSSVSSDSDEHVDDATDDAVKLQSYKDMLYYMQPNETILKSLRRLGGGNSNPSRKWQKNKTKEKKENNSSIESLEKLTGLANDLLQNGDYEIYQATFEKLTHLVKVEEEKKVKIPKGTNDDDAFDMFADSIDTKQSDKPKDEEMSTSSQVKWQYKWKEGDETEEVHGPYTSEEMNDWTEQGFFKEKSILVRKTTDKLASFYDAARIDFDLYI